MTTVLAVIGESALYLLYVWLASSIAASYLSGKKGYGERVGLACGLLLSFIAVLVWIFVPSKPTSDWGRRKAERRKGATAG